MKFVMDLKKLMEITNLNLPMLEVLKVEPVIHILEEAGNLSMKIVIVRLTMSV